MARRAGRLGCALLGALDLDPRVAGHYRLDAVRAHLLDMSGDHDQASVHYRRAAEGTLSIPERDYLRTKGARHSSAERNDERNDERHGGDAADSP